MRTIGHGAELPDSHAQVTLGNQDSLHDESRKYTPSRDNELATAPHVTVFRPLDGIDRSLLDSLDPSVCEARVFLIFRLSSILTLIDDSVCFSRTTMIPPDCLEDCLPWINLAARAWMGNLEVGRNAALLVGTRRERERETKGITGNRKFKHSHYCMS